MGGRGQTVDLNPCTHMGAGKSVDLNKCKYFVESERFFCRKVPCIRTDTYVCFLGHGAHFLYLVSSHPYTFFLHL